MGETKIEYCTKVWSPVTGCTHSGSPGCDHCWAAAMVKRFPPLHGLKLGDTKWENLPFSEIRFHPHRLDEPLRWRKPQRVFVCSMGDLFHPEVSVTWLESVLAVITRCPQHTFMILSKRPERFLLLTEDRLRISRTDTWPIRNLWLGVSVENQQTADERIPILLKTPAAMRFVSVEPMLGPVDLREVSTFGVSSAAGNKLSDCLNWVICGSESGPNRRPCSPDWIKSLRDQCVATGVPFFLKQIEVNGKLVKMPLIDGRVWDQIPEGR